MRGRAALSLGIGLMISLASSEVGALTLPAAGQIFVSDINRIVRIDDMTGAGWISFGTPGNGIGQFHPPTGIFVGPTGQIFVTDRWNDRIVRIDDMTGAGWTTFGTHGSGINQFHFPDHIFVNTTGQIFVSDSVNSRIVRINDMTGAGWISFGTPGIVTEPAERGINQFGETSGIFVSASGQIIVGTGTTVALYGSTKA